MNDSLNDVAIIGVGLHPFGRFQGKSAMAMAADAIQLALAMPAWNVKPSSSRWAAAKAS